VFLLACLVILVWAVTGLLFRFSDTWQLVINTSTTIVTFLMVFLIQRAQNKDSLAIHLKLNEIVAALSGASNRLVDVESLSEKELAQLHRFYRELASLCRNEIDLTNSHSVEEARQRHSLKQGQAKSRE
jgi:low affinity Fe/Cu permease